MASGTTSDPGRYVKFLGDPLTVLTDSREGKGEDEGQKRTHLHHKLLAKPTSTKRPLGGGPHGEIKNLVDETSKRTLRHYEERADAFWEGTRDHDVTQNIDALLSCLPEGGEGQRVLDFGCGPGRDLKALTERGVLATGLDGCEAFYEMALAHSGCEVIHQDFLALDLPAESFAGIFANASLFHVPTAHLKRVLDVLFSTLLPGGVLLSSNPRGGGEEGWNADRYGVYHDFERWSHWLTGSHFTPIRHYYRPEGLPRAEQNWLASLWRKPKV